MINVVDALLCACIMLHGLHTVTVSYVSITYETVCGGYGAKTSGERTVCGLFWD